MRDEGRNGWRECQVEGVWLVKMEGFEGTPPRLLLLLGADEESFVRAVSEFSRALGVAPEVLRGEEGELARALGTPPLVGEARLVVIRVPRLSPAEVELLRSHALSDEKGLHVVVEVAQGSVPPDLLEAVPKGCVVGVGPVLEGEGELLLREELKARGLELPPWTLRDLARRLGKDRGRLARAVEQLASSPDPEGLASTLAGEETPAPVFRVADALLAGDAGRALGLARPFLGSQEELTGFYALLARYFRMLVHACLAPPAEAEEAARKAGATPKQAPVLVSRARRLPLRSLLDAYREVLSADWGARSGEPPPPEVVLWRVGEILSGGRRRAAQGTPRRP